MALPTDRPSYTGDRPSQSHLPPPPPAHPSLRSTHSSPPAYQARRVPPALPARQQVIDASSRLAEETPAIITPPGSFEPSTLPEAEEELSEVQLRKLYDDEEIDRFLHLFSAYVREARTTDSREISSPKLDLETTTHDTLPETSGEVDENEDWVPLDDSPAKPVPPPLPPRPKKDRAITERIAMDYLIPLLPPAPPQPPAFTLQRLQLTAQRLYLATKPAYGPFIARLAHLATWQETNTSLVYCAAYWFLWYHNFLLPALVLRIIYSLVRRKLLPYPNLEELREHRREVVNAKEFSVAITSRLVASPTYDVQDVWRLFRDLNLARKIKKAAKRNGKDKESLDEEQVQDEESAQPEKIPLPHTPKIDEVDVKRAALSALNDVADLHERVKNIFLWRRPAISLVYGVVLVALFCLTLIPAKYLAKLLGLILGVGFWHVVPIIAAIPPADRARFPPPFTDLPTDADYAMELISQRVARGLDIKPRLHRTGLNTPGQDLDAYSIRSEEREGSIKSVESSSSSTSVNWKKWGERVVTTKAATNDVRQMFQDGQWKRPENWLALNPLAPKVAIPGSSSVPRMQTFTFPAQYKKASGLITLTSDTFYFTSLLSSTAKLSIPVKDMLGVKKTGPMRGLNVRWAQSNEDGHREEKEEKFLWVGARNELFARLVAWGGRRWANV